MRMVAILAIKREGIELSSQETEFVIEGFMDGKRTIAVINSNAERLRV
ncbi:hypothetical protein [Pseudogracilibacillus auburnensis]|nr:hypothetical protein [Pseudogracilibacillus auburnensis]MBO1005091.1 hypothetical protein [Pseudogracilibacillus auburnensis]